MDQKSRAEQNLAKSHASETGDAPGPLKNGNDHMNASVENVVCTCKSPNKICFSDSTARICLMFSILFSLSTTT